MGASRKAIADLDAVLPDISSGKTMIGRTTNAAESKAKNTGVAPQVPQPQYLKPTSWERLQGASRVPPERHREDTGGARGT